MVFGFLVVFLTSLKEELAWRDMWPEIACWKVLVVLTSYNVHNKI